MNLIELNSNRDGSGQSLRFIVSLCGSMRAEILSRLETTTATDDATVRYHRSPVHRIACGATRRVPLHWPCSGQIARERRMEEASEQEKERTEKEGRALNGRANWLGGGKLRPFPCCASPAHSIAIVQLLSPLKISTNTEKGRPMKLVVLFSIHQPINSTSHLRSRN